MKDVQVTTGGKLYLAGEYAVLTPGQTALIHYIPICMTAKACLAQETKLSSDMFAYSVDRTFDCNYQLIQASIDTFEAYSGQTLPDFELSITGKLERDGLKFGIGSSGSVTVLTIKALAALVDLDLSCDTLFKLAAYTLIKLGDNGSMGDIACIAYEKLIAYRSFDRQKIAEQITTSDLESLLDQDWGYEIEVLTPKLRADFLVGWTRQPAISRDMIQAAKSLIDQSFLKETEKNVQITKQALLTADKESLKAGLQKISDLLEGLSSAIYVDQLKALKEAEQGLDVIAKSSGSGGGDCGIALSFSPEASRELIERWQARGIELLYQEHWIEVRDDKP
ncbi:phosphomevalonate kinase [Streptococcus saliviloxodontae]|uniref:phosphomevalonate kinase n=1 Tax=Streptococcus saliviloxodontae TaxID=1349416 RepID=A0ABS2PPC7_9STRE|nr:phosphomevalonate kinase [Streptococcus saliviloxodontae]MBM7636816.1 phosphomevalonate kinase [Streptococcus saliviloxodontae]